MADKPETDAATDAAAAVNGAEPTDLGGSAVDASSFSDPGTVREMRCVTLTGFGGVRMVKVQRRPEAKPLEGEVLVRVKACGINFTDLMARQGAIDNPPKTPFIMGFECAGEIETLGPNASRFAVGDRVIAVTDYGSWAETVSVPEQFVYRIPTGMTFEDAAAVFMNYVTAYILLFDLGNLREGRSVLVHSAGGGVGLAVAQLAKTVPAAEVFGTASALKHDAIKGVVDHVYDHSTDYVQEIKKVSPEGVDIVLDSLCGEDTNKGIAILKPLGKYILFGSSNVVTGETKSFFSFAKSWWQMDKISPIRLHDENKTIAGFHLRQLIFKQNGCAYVRTVVDHLFRLYDAGKIKPVIDSVWAFEDISEAMQKMHDRKNIGKLLLIPSMEPKSKPDDANGHKFMTFTLITIQKTSDSPRENNEAGGGGAVEAAAAAGDDDKASKKEDKN